MSDSNVSRTYSESTENDCDIKLKIMVLGDSMVGKTSIINRYVNGGFGERYLCTIGIDFKEKIITKNNREVKLQIWDTAGQERYKNVTKSYFQASNGFIIAYDINCNESFNQVKYWIEQIKNMSDEKTKFILVGTKCDLDTRKVDEEKGLNLAKKFGIKFFETSAKLNINVDETFNSLIVDILLNYKETKRRSLMISSKKMKKEKKKNCC